MFNKKNVLLACFLMSIMSFTISCDKDNSTSTGSAQVEITDGPIDDAEVKSVFVTVAEVKIDGKTFSGFSGKKTIDVKVLNQGNTQVLGIGSLDAGSYQNLSIVLDYSKDASGNTPGCYVETVNGTKHALSTQASQEITLAKNFVIESGKTTNLVLDFDLRKAVAYQSGSATDKYDFVSAADLNSAVRLVVKSQTGTIKGTCNNSTVASDKIVVFAYKKGSFSKSTETQSSNGVSFKNAVTSTVVDNSGNFKLSFVESGDYELHFASYKDTNSDGKLDLRGMLNLTTVINLLGINVAANAEVSLVATVSGLQ